ncbi:MAG: hypothetical protein ACE5E1_11135 [Phycisphaerae bacterium]
MATRRYGISQDEAHYQVTEAVGLATVGDPVELTIDLAVIASKEEAIRLTRQILDFIVEGDWPPA